MGVSIIIPTKDEPKVQELLDEVNKELRSLKHEIIVVDKSKEELKLVGARVLRQESEGLARAIIEGIENAKYDKIIVMDGDFSHDPKDVKKLLEALERSEIVIGSKYMKGSRDESFLSRKLISRTANFLAKFLLGLETRDCISGFFGFKRIKEIKLKGMGFKLSTELLFKLKGKVKIEEVPINFRKRRYGKSKFNLLEIFNFLILLARLKLKFII